MTPIEQLHYNLGRVHALQKLGMQLQFDNPQQAAQHAKRRELIGDVGGVAGGIAGGMAGGALGTVAGGPAGSVAGGLAGGYLGEKMVSAPLTTAYDTQHDVRQRARADYGRAMQRLNVSGGMPSGAR